MRSFDQLTRMEGVVANLEKLKALAGLYALEYLDISRETFVKYAAYNHESMVNLHCLEIDIIVDCIIQMNKLIAEKEAAA